MSVTVRACLGCEGRCCAAYIVPLTGNDVWHIVQEQRLEPGLFVQREPEDYPSSTGFLLRPGGQTYALALRHQYDRRNERPCILLMHLRAGVQRCGIYPHRPRACQTYPMQLKPSGVVSREDMMCPNGSWAGITEQPGEWREQLIQQDDEWERYATVVQAWNIAVSTRPSDSGYVLNQYLGYLVSAYDELNTPPDQISYTTRRDRSLTDLAAAWTAAG